MRAVVHEPADAGSRTRLAVEPGRALRRSAGLCVGFSGLALALGASWPLAVWLASAVLLAMAIERLAVTREAGKRIRITSAAAQAEGQRDAVARVMSLELAYERSRSVVEALSEGVVVVDEIGEIVLANPAVRRAMLHPNQEPVGRVLWEVLTPQLAQRSREVFEALRAERTSDDELPQVRYAGIACHDRVYDLTAVQVTSRRTGQDFGTAFLLVDTTRTHELQRIKERFLSSISHELRTPLTNICAYSEILSAMAPGDAAEWPEFVRVIHDEGLQLSELVDAMFDYLQLESGEVAFAAQDVDGGEVVREVVPRVVDKSGATARGVEVSVDVVDDAPSLLVDRARFEQVVRNLLDNAIKFSPDGGRVAVVVRVRDGRFELRIEDSGPGVPEQDRTAVFEKFNQLNEDMTDKPDGAGIGLAISRAIVARFGGLIWCEDADIGGAAFVVLLPGKDQPLLVGPGAGTGAGGGF